MKFGVVYPQTELGRDPIVVRDFAQAAEEMGYTHLLVYDHVMGADPEGYPGWDGPYTHKDLFHEPFVLFGYLAGVTQSIELVTGVLVLGQRQTVLAAKQAAEVDVISGGRLRLGVGTGWNAVEYEALGEDFHNRGARSEEQIAVLRALWSQEVVNFEGRWHRVRYAGINPRPAAGVIPIWLGGEAPPVIQRVARIADGWMPRARLNAGATELIEQLHACAREVDRDPASIGIDARVPLHDSDPEVWATEVGGWDAAGASHISANTLRAGFTSLDQHLDALRLFKDAAGL